KMPRELSRFQHLIFLGDAFKKTHDKKYAEAFTAQITDWLEKNPYLLGPNWVCPMDVGIRAVNWVIAFTYFKESDINENFWQQFICSLYDHMIYLEHNWEVYDSRTSNHYLSDLIGYFYLCWFFKGYKGIEKKALWCYQELLKECEKQIHDDGSDYEGSTYYHRLVTEIFYHVFLLAPELGFAVPSHFVTVLQNMMSFIAWCTPKQGKLIQIGDNDAGKIVTGIDNALVQSMAEKTEGVKTFASYGLTVLKNDIMHLSLRHHAYNALQPSGHFHNDVGSITLALNGNNIFVDPGSYTYTPSAIWRNRFRSATVHNTFFIEGHEPVPFDEHLFSLQLSERVHDGNDFYMKHDLYKRFGLRAHRRLEHSDSAIMLFDHWEYTGLVDPALVACWNFTLAPDIEVVHDASAIILKKNNETIARMQSSLYFEIIDGWYSPSYGIKIPCKQLRAKKIIDEKEVKIEISF
ncbi:MAG: alginate lyase family protein, partial [Candidatus Babeliales bacterium]